MERDKYMHSIEAENAIQISALSILERLEQPGHLSYKESHDKMKSLLDDVEQLCIDILYEES